MKDDRLYFEHMLEAIQLVEQYSANLTWEQFVKDTKAQDAIIRRLEIIGEASNRVPQTIKDKLPNAPWKKMLGMRNIIVHDYMYVDLQEVWDVVQNDLSSLKKMLQDALNKLAELQL